MTAAPSLPMARRLLLPAVLALSLFASLVYFVRQNQAFALLTANSDDNLFGVPRRGPVQGNRALADVAALAASPLDQRAVNAVIAARLRATGDVDRAMRETALLRQLGWRNTPALQNILWRAGLTGNLPLLMDTVDALLRRQKLLGQIYPLLNLMTTDRRFRDLLIARLAGRPSWRQYYFLAASDLSRPDQIEGRFLVMQALQRRGDRLTRNEVAPLMAKLTGLGRSDAALQLWRAQHGAVATPLADPAFAEAAKPLPGDALPIAFEWLLASGSGYFADAGRDERGSYMSIDWNGRGTPVLASQLTTARAGRYELIVAGDPPMAPVADRIGFRLVCPDGATTLFRPTGRTNGGRLRLIATARVACDFPTLQLFGQAQTGSSSASILLRSLRLKRVG